MIDELDKNNISIRQTDTGFEAQSCYLEKIRSIEKQFITPQNSKRNNLRDLLDKIVMQAIDFDDVFVRLGKFGYEVKHGKYFAIKPPNEERFIRIKSLGEMYSEQALRNRIDNRNVYEKSIDDKLKSLATNANSNVLEYRVYATVRQYVLTFKSGKLPAKKVRKEQPFTWVNDAELDRLASLNKKINEGVNLISLQNDMARLEKSIFGLEETLERFKLHENPDEWAINEIEKTLADERDKLKETAEILIDFEEILSMTYVDKLLQDERSCRNAEVVNGVKQADVSLAESARIDEVAERVIEVSEEQERRSCRRL